MSPLFHDLLHGHCLQLHIEDHTNIMGISYESSKPKASRASFISVADGMLTIARYKAFCSEN